MKQGKAFTGRFVFPAILIGVFLVFGCMHHRTPGDPPTRKASDATTRICVMPFLKGRYPASVDQPVDRTLTCRLEELCHDEADLQGPADRILTRQVVAYLQTRLGENRIAPLSDVMAAFQTLEADPRNETIRSMAVRMGRKMSAEWVLAGTVWRYRERIGKSLGVEEPASVAFAVFLIETKTGGRIWQGGFDETQRSLSENLLKAPDFFRRGAKWLTAEELVRAGIEETFRSFPEFTR